MTTEHTLQQANHIQVSCLLMESTDHSCNFINFTHLNSQTHTSNMRGDRKRKKTMYKRGHIAQKKGEINKEADPHTPHSKSNHVKYHRFDYEQFKAISDSDQDIIRVVDVEGCALDQIKLLRPLQKQPTCVDKLCQQQTANATHMPGYRLVKLDRFERLWQRSIREHTEFKPECTGMLKLDNQAERKVGLCWQEAITCSHCDYFSGRDTR